MRFFTRPNNSIKRLHIFLIVLLLFTLIEGRDQKSRERHTKKDENIKIRQYEEDKRYQLEKLQSRIQIFTDLKQNFTIKQIQKTVDQLQLAFGDIDDFQLMEVIDNLNKSTALSNKQSKRNLQTYDPCLTYTSDNVCAQCDEANGYYLALWNTTYTICAYTDLSDSYYNYYGDYYYCIIDYDYYPDISDFYDNVWWYLLFYTSPTGVNYCFDDYIFLMTDVEYDYVCDIIDIFYEMNDYMLSTIYAKSEYYCVQCATPPYLHSVVVYSPIGFYIGQCEEQDYSCSYTQYYDTSTAQCTECTEVFKNCAACDETECIMCAENFYWNPAVYDYETQDDIGQCVFDTCPAGYCKSDDLFDCVTSTLDNCLRCYQEYDDWDEVDYQYCQICENGYYLDADDLQCYEIADDSIELWYFVTSEAVVQWDSLNYYLHIPEGTEPSDASYSIGYTVTRLQSDYQYDYTSINATIFVGKGQHFLYICDGDEYALTYYKNDTSNLADYCNIYDWENLQRQDFINDNFTITIEALQCSYADILGYSGDSDFEDLCVDFEAGDEKPIVYVNNEQSYFNVTGVLKIKNLRFSGINGLAWSPVNGYNIAVYPLLYCDATKEPNGVDGVIKLTRYELSVTEEVKFDYYCEDPYYQGSTVPKDSSSRSTCINNENSQFSTSQSSTLSCPGEPTYSDFYDQSLYIYQYFRRRRTLFNLYAFADHTTIRNATPELYIENCEFEYFLRNYESLINVETSSFVKMTANNTKYSGYDSDTYETIISNETRAYYSYQQADRGAKISINGSSFKHSRFCKGMIVYRKAPYEDNSRALVNFTHLYMESPIRQDNGSFILLYNSVFTHLNAFSNVSALAIYGGEQQFVEMSANSLDPVNVPSFMHKGIVLNVEDFNGWIEIVDCEFEKNFHFIPQIYYNYHLKSQVMNADLFKDTATTLEYQLAVCNPTTFTDDYFFNKGFGVDQDIDELYDEFERLSVIYISRNKQRVIIKDNYFSKNIGTFGGAISINSPDWQKGELPYVVIYNNDFERNMAYFSGNAIYIRNTLKSDELYRTCAGVNIIQNTFTNNIGMKLHNGGAVAAYCKYLTSTYHQDYDAASGYSIKLVASDRTDLPYTYIKTNSDSAKIKIDRFSFNIKSNDFTQNFSGMKGTALYIRQMSYVYIYNCTFLLNGPVTSIMEYYYSPYSGYLSSHAITFYDKTCFDEYDYMTNCNTVSNSYIDFPRVEGAVHVIFCQQSSCLNSSNTQTLEISNSEFLKNEAGPILEERYDSTYATSSNLQILGGFNNLISECKFFDNKGSLFYYTNMKRRNLTKFFPGNTTYFEYSQSSLINIYMDPESPLTFVYFNTTIQNTQFYRNKNTQVVGLTTYQQYKGSLVKIMNYDTSATNYLPNLNIKQCTFQENSFLGEDSSLIYSYNSILRITSSTFQNNGYISTTTYDVSESDVTLGSTQFPFSSYSYDLSQYYGAIYVEGNIEMPLNQTHEFVSNTFSFMFAQYGSAYSFNLNDQQAYLYGNTYKYMFAQYEGSLMFGSSSSARATIAMERENINHMYSANKGVIVIKPSKQDLMNIFVNNSYFDNMQSGRGVAFYLLQAGQARLYNVTLTRTSWYEDAAAFVKSKFTKIQLDLSGLIDLTLFKYLLNEVENISGYFYLQDLLNTEAVTFAGKTLIPASYKYLSFIEILNCNITNSYSLYNAIVDSSTSKIRVYNQVKVKERFMIYNNTGYYSGGFGLFYNTEFVGENLLFYQNKAQVKSNSIYLSGSKAEIINATFLENYSEFVGTVMVESSSSLLCSYCYFIRNYAYDSSSIFAYNNIDSQVSVSNSQFLNNTSTMNLLSFLYSKGTISDSIFLDNISEKVNNGFTLVNSHLNVSNILVNFTDYDFLYNNEYNVDTGFFNLNYQSTISVSNSRLLNSRGAIGALMYATGSSSVEIKENTLIKNIQSRSGSVIYATMTEFITIKDTRFEYNSQSDVFFDQTEGIIENSVFIQGEQEFIWAQTANITVTGNKFLDGWNKNVPGKALYCNCQNMIVTNNTFQNLSAVTGGAMYIYSNSLDSNFTIKDNDFIENYAQQGGAIYIQDSVNLDIVGNSFIRNKAEVITPKTLESSKLSDKGLGGAIFYDCNNDDIKEMGGCNVNIKDQNDFLSNYASNDGGAILWISNPFTDDNTNSFRNNTAHYGDNLGSYPKEIYIEILNNNDYVNPYTANETRFDRRILQETSYIPTLVSGTPFSFLVYILDQNGNIYNSDSSSKATFKYTGSSRVIVTGNEQIANEGVYNFSNVEIASTPGSELNFKIEVTGLETYANAIEFVVNGVNFNVTLRECVIGEQYTSDSRCDKCDIGTYLYEAPQVETSCKTCSSSATCYGAFVVAPKFGYWRSSNVSENFIQCPNPPACLAGDENHTTGICGEGYKGIVCGDCDDNYSKVAQFECSACPERVRNIVQITFIMIAAVFYVAFVVRSTLNSSAQDKPMHSVYLKIMTNHFQVLSAISNIDYQWPSEIEQFTENQNKVSSVSDQVLSFDCFLMNNGRDDGIIPVYYQKLIMYGLMPLLLGAFDILFWLLLGCIRKRNYSNLRSNFTSTLVVLLFLVHPNIAKVMFLSFNCLNVDGVFRLKENINSICYNGEHLSYIMIISAPSVILWAIGIPLFAFILLRANKQSLLLQDKQVITESENEKVKVVKMKYGFIFIGYKGAAYFWEVILMYRKVGIIMATVFLSTLSSEAQVLAVMLIIVISMLLQVRYEPYNTKILNKMETYSLQVAALTLYAGMYYITGTHYSYMDNDGLSWFFLIFIVTPNAIFFAYWGYYMRLEVLKQVHKRNKPKIFKLLACQSQDVFYEKHLKFDITAAAQQTIVPDDKAEKEEPQELKEDQEHDDDDIEMTKKKNDESFVNVDDINLEERKTHQSINEELKSDAEDNEPYNSQDRNYDTQSKLNTQNIPNPRNNKFLKVHPESGKNQRKQSPNSNDEGSIPDEGESENQNDQNDEQDGQDDRGKENKMIDRHFERPHKSPKKYQQKIFDKIRILKNKKKKEKRYQDQNEIGPDDIKVKVLRPSKQLGKNEVKKKYQQASQEPSSRREFKRKENSLLGYDDPNVNEFH